MNEVSEAIADSPPFMALFIDSHVHILPARRLAGLVRWLKRSYPEHPVPETVGEKDILRDLGGEGVTHFFNLVYPLREEETEGLNLFNADFCARTPGAIPFASLHVETENKARLAEKLLRDFPFVGFKFHPFVQGFEPWDSRMEALYDFLAAAHRPVLFHTGFEAFYQKSMPIEALTKFVQRHPRLPLVLVHMAFPELERVFALLPHYPHLFLDATNVLSCFRPQFRPLLSLFPGGEKLEQMLWECLERFPGRVFFGSDHPAGMGDLKSIYQDLRSLPLSPHARAQLQGLAAKNFVSRFLPNFNWERNLQANA